MIDPTRITRYDRSIFELEQLILFCCCVAGKNAQTTAKHLDLFLTKICGHANPFNTLREMKITTISSLLKDCGIGCYNARAKTFNQLVRANLDLRTCSINDLEEIYGIGRKTSRFFILHTRENARCAILDTHIKKYLRGLGHSVPEVICNQKTYTKYENIFLELADQSGLTVAEFDLKLWNSYASKQENI